MTGLALPSNREEGWRWSHLAALPDLAARQPTGVVPAELPWLPTAGPRLLFVDGRLAQESSAPGPVQLGPVAAVGRDHPLAQRVGRDGWALRLGRDHATGDPIQIIHVSTGAADHLPAEIRLDDGAQASILETFVGEGWTNRLTAIRLGRGARLMVNRRLLGSAGFISLTDDAELDQGASLVLATISAGSRDTRLDGAIRLDGEGAYAEAGGALLARDRQRHDVNVVIRHQAPRGTSRQIWRSVADDQAICSVAARVEVARDAQKTDGEQSLKGLLLVRGAAVNAKPELEIFADDVKCAHGATVGQIDRNALFYLESRGVTPEEARKLLTRSFVADALERIGEEEVRDTFYREAEGWFD